MTVKFLDVNEELVCSMYVAIPPRSGETIYFRFGEEIRSFIVEELVWAYDCKSTAGLDGKVMACATHGAQVDLIVYLRQVKLSLTQTERELLGWENSDSDNGQDD